MRIARRTVLAAAVPAGRHGFTIVEIMIVVTIIGILTVIAVPYIREARRRAQDTAFINDLRLLSGQVFDMVGFQQGDFPPDAPPGVKPAGVEALLPSRFEWEQETDIGGFWDWQRAPHRGQRVDGICYAGIAVYQPGRTSEQMRDIDARMDDGDLSTGMFRSSAAGYIHVVDF